MTARPPERPPETETEAETKAGPAGQPVPLALAPPGSDLELVEVRGGRRFLYRLAEMGLGRGTRFRVVTRGRVGPVIISVKGMRLMLGRGMVQRILVRPVGP